MSSSVQLRLFAGVALALAAASSAHAVQLNWNFSPGAPGSYSNYAYSSGGGSIDLINSTFDTVTKRLTFNVQFGPSSPGALLDTRGFWLVLNDGPDPKGKPGELAIIYFDASTLATPRMTVYGYNGANAANSWQDGVPATSGVFEPGDLIKGLVDAGSYINNLSAQDMNISGTGVRRVMSFDIDAADLINHSPLYPSAGVDWHGTGFGENLGIWFHPVKAFNATYDLNRGGINSLQLGAQGYLDGRDFIVPAPGAVALLGLGGLAIARRRR